MLGVLGQHLSDSAEAVVFSEFEFVQYRGIIISLEFQLLLLEFELV